MKRKRVTKRGRQTDWQQFGGTNENRDHKTTLLSLREIETKTASNGKKKKNERNVR